MYIYENHLGGLYAMETELSFDDRHCEECGDTDSFIGEADTKEDALDILEDYTDIEGSGGYSLEYIQKFVDETF